MREIFSNDSKLILLGALSFFFYTVFAHKIAHSLVECAIFQSCLFTQPKTKFFCLIKRITLLIKLMRSYILFLFALVIGIHAIAGKKLKVLFIGDSYRASLKTRYFS